MAVRLARAATAEGARRADDGGSSTTFHTPVDGGRSPEGAPKNIKDVYWRPQESDSDTMLNKLLNILWRTEEREREERER